MFALKNPIHHYAWGSHSALAELLGKAVPTAQPEAELWLGAHPKAPSSIETDGVWVSLLEALRASPQALLGPASFQRYGAELPFLLKLIAAERPLSLQAHPNAEQARTGFEREEAAQIPISAPQRNYKDAHHKPELLVALTRFEALCGFRPVAQSLRLLHELAIVELKPIVSRLERQPDARGLRRVFTELLTCQRETRCSLVGATLSTCEHYLRHSPASALHSFKQQCAWVLRLGELYPDDVGVVSALLLNFIALEPGQGIYVPAGRLHAYLGGLGIEVMANSDNVLRGGLTHKHMDVPEVLGILDFQPDDLGPLEPVELVGSGGGPVERAYRTPAEEFRLAVLELKPPACVPLRPWGPEILLCVEGSLQARAGSKAHTLTRGESLFIPGGLGSYELFGQGKAYRATVAPG